MSKRSEKLVVRFSALGDVTLITGVLDYWRRSRGWRCGVLTRAEFAPLLRAHPAVSEVIGLSGRELEFPASLGVFRRIARAYADADLIDLHNNLRTRLLAGLWKGRVFRYPKLGLERRLFLLSGRRCCGERLLEHNVPQRYALAVAERPPDRAELVPHIYLEQAELERAGQLLAAGGLGCGPTDPPLLALHPYATHSQKTWPAAYWRSLTEGLLERGINWFVLGRRNNNGERLQLAGAAGATAEPRAAGGAGRGCDYSNQTDLRLTCALLARASLLISADSGPMHLATAVGTPVLGLFGPTTRHWGFFPSGVNDQVLEADCPGRPFSLHGKSAGPAAEACMGLITPDTVLNKAVRMLAGLEPGN